ncbi:MAG: efflux RND transporter periplasmic adaptor subunit [Thermoanaerobaculia bacterium]|nr:efflux RND transporter periplasmic adaptor subunit [Thermoanaerobaculia bacterium]
MRTTLVSITLIAALAAGCSPERAGTATPVAATTLPADVQDLRKPETATTTPTATPKAQPAARADTTAPEAITATGELISSARSQLAPKNPGRVAAVFVREGERVRAGQPLAAFETDYLVLELRRAEAELARASAIEKDAARELERKRELIATESIPPAAYDRARTALESSTAARQAGEAVVATIRQRIADATLRAPFDGVVEQKMVSVGERLGDGAAFIVAQTSPLRLRFRLPEQYLGRIHNGQGVSATTDAYGAEPFHGRVSMIGGVVDPATRTFMVEADVDNQAGLLSPGLFSRVTVEK